MVFCFQKLILSSVRNNFFYLFTILFIFVIFQNGLYDFGKAFLTTLVSLVPFLERELIDTLPYVVASTLINFPSSLVEDVVDVLCWNLLPFAITNVNHPRFHRLIQTKQFLLTKALLANSCPLLWIGQRQNTL